ncbi:MAG TPA: ABC transporter permease [Mycobacteriales bacterium]|nr:ABC transporter permease [Mycobacteriales bacterium]
MSPREDMDMWLVTLRDLQWRLRRFVIAVVGTSVVFAMTLILAGLSDSFRAEAHRTVRGLGADAWVMREGVYGPFTTVAAMPASAAEDVAAMPGVRRADPLLILHQTVAVPAVTDVNLIGYRAGGLGSPNRVAGRLPSGTGEAVVDESLGLPAGATFLMAGQPFTVVGTTSGQTINAGQPMVFVPLGDAQRALVSGAPVATAVITQGVPERLPAGLIKRTPAETEADLLRPLGNAIQSLDLTQLLLWLVAALIIGSVVYLSALERLRDFAVFKATGWSSRGLLVGLALQAVMLSVAAALLAMGLARVLTPVFPLTITIPLRAMLLLPVVALGVGLAASVAGLRRAVTVEPALAFGGP